MRQAKLVSLNFVLFEALVFAFFRGYVLVYGVIELFALRFQPFEGFHGQTSFGKRPSEGLSS